MSAYRFNVAQNGDALALLRSLPDSCTPLGFFDPQYRGVMDKLKFGNEEPRGLITRLISALTNPGDLIIDPAAGSFVVMHGAHELERDFIGCDVSYARNVPEFNGRNDEVGLFNEGTVL